MNRWTISAVALFAVLSRAGAGQDEPIYSDWGAPVNLGAVINSAGAEQHPALSKDGLSLYVTSNRPGGFGGLDIWVSRRPNTEADWGALENLGANVNSASTEMAPAFSPDEHTLYWHSNKPGGFGGFDLYVARRQNRKDDLGWGPAENLGGVVNSAFDDAGATYYEDEEAGIAILYFTSTRPGGAGPAGEFDIWASTLGADGQFGAPGLVTELSSPARDTRTAIRRRDGLELLISSGREGGFGDQDLWASTRATTSDPWSAPVNLGATVNTASFDGAMAMSFDGTTLMFFSNRPGGFGGNDLYMTTRTKNAK